MTSNTPPIQLLPAFEAAARLQSFKAAAEELCVTPSAVSQQIKNLEQHLGTALFQRSSRQVVLSEPGLAYYDVANKTLNRFKYGHQRWLASQASPIIRLSTTAQIAFDILIPALPSFHEQHPEIDLRIETTDKLASFDTEAVDLAIRLGDGKWSGLHCQKLSSLSVCGLAAPSLLAKQPIHTLEAMQQATLIHARTDVNDWEIAEQKLGISFANNKQLYFENYHTALSAAENGMGVALGLLPLTQSRINSGRLHTFGAPPLPLEQACYFVHKTPIEADGPLDKVAQWLQSEFAQLTAK